MATRIPNDPLVLVLILPCLEIAVMELPRFGSGSRLKPYRGDSTVDVEEKQKAVSVALWKQKLTTFEDIFNEATLEEREDLLRLHIWLWWQDLNLRSYFTNASSANREH